MSTQTHQLFDHYGPTCRKCGLFGKALENPVCAGTLTAADWERFGARERRDAKRWTSYALNNPETPVHKGEEL